MTGLQRSAIVARRVRRSEPWKKLPNSPTTCRSPPPDEREYPDAADQIREVLIHGNYLSQKDIEICLGFDVESLADRPEIDAMRELHAPLVEKYKSEDANSAA